MQTRNASSDVEDAEEVEAEGDVESVGEFDSALVCCTEEGQTLKKEKE